jgi:hypothetical protein
VTLLVTPDRTVRVRIVDPLAALSHARYWARRIHAEPLPLFPRTLLAWQQSGHDLVEAQRELSGDDGGFTQPEVERGWFPALYRDSQPDLATAIEVGGQVYGPIFADCAIEKVKGR